MNTFNVIDIPTVTYGKSYVIALDGTLLLNTNGYATIAEAESAAIEKHNELVNNGVRYMTITIDDTLLPPNSTIELGKELPLAMFIG